MANQQESVNQLQRANPEVALKEMQKKLIRECVAELLYPVRRDFNVDLKSLSKIIEECVRDIKEQQARHNAVREKVDAMQREILRSLKNSESDKTALNYELKRMQYLDRIKIRHVKGKFDSNDEGRDLLLPSIDTAYASCNLLEVGEKNARSRM